MMHMFITTSAHLAATLAWTAEAAWHLLQLHHPVCQAFIMLLALPSGIAPKVSAGVSQQFCFRCESQDLHASGNTAVILLAAYIQEL